MKNFAKISLLFLFFCSVIVAEVTLDKHANVTKIEGYNYRTKTDNQTYQSTIKYKHMPNQVLVTLEAPFELNTYLYETSGNMLEWQRVNKPEGTDIKAVRKGNTIEISGQLKNKPVERKVKIDSAPWFQSFSYSFGECIINKINYQEFWAFKMSDLELNKMFMKQNKTELIEIDGQKVEALKTRVSVVGFRSAFWSAYYWHRIDDGICLRYLGDKGPGTPMSEIVLIGEPN